MLIILILTVNYEKFSDCECFRIYLKIRRKLEVRSIMQRIFVTVNSWSLNPKI